jgi:hypothetical protein
MTMLNESVPVPQSPEEPPLAPYDPPDPAPQALAWRRALRVVAGDAARREVAEAKTRTGRSWKRGTSSAHS